MIVRVVKMTFRPAEVPRFLDLFEGWRHRIIAFPGCHHLELLQDIHDRRVLLTYSTWESPAALEDYRNSEVFNSVWPVVKPLFAAPAQAWSLNELHRMDRPA